MERANEDSVEDPNATPVGNNNGRNLKVEALTTVRQLERFLAKSVARQWYDMERTTFHFIQKIKTDGPITFAYDVSDIMRFDLRDNVPIIRSCSYCVYSCLGCSYKSYYLYSMISTRTACYTSLALTPAPATG